MKFQELTDHIGPSMSLRAIRACHNQVTSEEAFRSRSLEDREYVRDVQGRAIFGD